MTFPIGLVEVLANLGIQIFKKKNTQEARKYAEELADLKTKYLNELRKPMEQWCHSDIEKWLDRISAIAPLAEAELENLNEKK